MKNKLLNKTKQKFNCELERKYEARFRKFGATPQGSYWINETRQNLRFKILLDEAKKIQKPGIFSLGDIGCGYGALAQYIVKNQHNKFISYYGYDISQELIGHCGDNQSHQGVQFRVGSKPHIKLDFCLMSGTYNLSATHQVDEWENYVFHSLNDCWLKTKTAMIFNLQVCKKAHISSGNIFYGNKASILNQCKVSFGPTFSVDHPDLPHDTTFVVKRN